MKYSIHICGLEKAGLISTWRVVRPHGGCHVETVIETLLQNKLFVTSTLLIRLDYFCHSDQDTVLLISKTNKSNIHNPTKISNKIPPNFFLHRISWVTQKYVIVWQQIIIFYVSIEVWIIKSTHHGWSNVVQGLFMHFFCVNMC